MERASAAILLRCLRGKGKAEGQTDKPQGQTDEDASLPGLQSRISITPVRCTFLLQRLPAIDIPSPEGCPLAPSQAAVVEAVSFHQSDAPSSCTNRFSPSSALQKSDLNLIAKNRPRMRAVAVKPGQKAIIGQPKFSDCGHRSRSGAREVDTSDGRFVWISLHEPDQPLLRTVQQRFGLHDLAIEDALRAHQRPKLEIYGDSLFIVLSTASLQDRKIRCGETHIS